MCELISSIGFSFGWVRLTSSLFCSIMLLAVNKRESHIQSYSSNYCIFSSCNFVLRFCWLVIRWTSKLEIIEICCLSCNSSILIAEGNRLAYCHSYLKSSRLLTRFESCCFYISSLTFNSLILTSDCSRSSTFSRVWRASPPSSRFNIAAKLFRFRLVWIVSVCIFYSISIIFWLRTFSSSKWLESLFWNVSRF